MTSKKKVTYILSDIEKSLAFEWVAQHLSVKFDMFFILIGKRDTPLAKHLEKLKIRFEVIPDDSFPTAFQKWLRVFFALRKERPFAIHAHMWRATLLGLSAGWALRIKKRIFSRHHAVPHYTTQPSGRKWDKLCNALATDIVAISENVKNVLKQDGANPMKVHLIHHGFDIDYFQRVEEKAVQQVRIKYNIPQENWPVVGVISRYLELKGIQFIIPAFQKLVGRFPHAHLVLANAHGDFELPIKALLRNLPPGSYTEIRFENDLAALYKLFNVYVHTPVSLQEEAFGQTYVEALAAGVPSVFSLSGVAPEFIEHKINAWVVPYGDANSIEEGILQIVDNTMLRDSLIKQGLISVNRFSLNNMLSKLEALYE